MLLESPQAAAKRISARWGKSNMSREMHHLMRWHKLVVDAELVEAARLVFTPHARRNYAVAYGSARFEVAYERLQPAGFPNLYITCKNARHDGLSVGGIAFPAATHLVASFWACKRLIGICLVRKSFVCNLSKFKRAFVRTLLECRHPLFEAVLCAAGAPINCRQKNRAAFMRRNR